MLTQEQFDSYLKLSNQDKTYLRNMCEEMLQDPNCPVPLATVRHWITLIEAHQNPTAKILYMADYKK
jgi:hypothetical protein